MDAVLWVELVIFIVLMGLSGFFSSSETALFSLNKIQLEQMARDGNTQISLIERLLSEPRRLIVTILIGNEFVNVAASTISAAVVIQLLGAENKLLNLFIMVPILLLVGEITPKTLAIRNNVAFASFQAAPIDFFARMIMPLRWIVRLVSDWFTTLIVGKERTRGSIVTQDMVRTLAREAVGDGVLHRSEAQYIDHIFEFGNMSLADVMTPRSNIFFLPSDMPLKEMLAELRRTRHNKVPVYEGQHRDEVIGILYGRDLLKADLSQDGGQPEDLSKVLREPYFVPETKPVADLFRVFRRRKLSIALTVDEYGGVTGLVTMEDLLECIFGELPSASEVLEEAQLRKRVDGTDRIDASMTVDQFNKDFKQELPTDRSETIGGLILTECGELPLPDAKVKIGAVEFKVTEVDTTRITQVTMKISSKESEAKLRVSSTANAKPSEADAQATEPESTAEAMETEQSAEKALEEDKQTLAVSAKQSTAQKGA